MPKKTETLAETIKKPKRAYHYKSEATKAAAHKGLLKGTAVSTAHARENLQSYRDSLANHVRLIGQEEIEVNGKNGVEKWTRIDAVVRRMYADAIGGKTAAQELIFERGWGKVAAPVQIDLKAEFTQIVRDSGLKWEEVLQDPILGAIAKSAGVEVVESVMRELPLLEAPKEK
jgi:hypothetical protein